MADGLKAALPGASRTSAPAAPARRRGRRAEPWLVAVGAAFTLAQLLLVGPGFGLGWDETVYVSQVSGLSPAAFFSAPRARGVPLLVAPLASWSGSPVLLRTYLAVLSGLALSFSLHVWRAHVRPRVLALAGALFASLWVTVFYGPQAMPNYWVAVGALACAGYWVRARAGARDRAAWWGVSAGAALMALMRPMDAVYVALPLLATSLRRPRLLLRLVAGLVAGGGEWVVEAYAGYGGLARRLADASRIQGGLGWHLAALDQLRSLGGRTLCRPCRGPLPAPWETSWWFALPLLAAFGAVAALRVRRGTPALVAGACGVTAAVPYLFLIGYAAPRFLLPAYALLALPAAQGVAHLLARAGRGSRRPAAAALAAALLAAHLAAQYAVLDRTVRGSSAGRSGWSRTAAALHTLGVRPPCLLSGYDAIPIAFLAGCGSAQTAGHDASTDATSLSLAARRMPLAVLTAPDGSPPAYARGWPVRRVGGLRAYVAPSALRGR